MAGLPGPRSGALPPIHLEAAINLDALSSKVVTIGRGEKNSQPTDFPRGRHPAKGNVLADRLLALGGRNAFARWWRPGQAGSDRIDQEPLRREFERQTARPSEQPPFAALYAV